MCWQLFITTIGDRRVLLIKISEMLLFQIAVEAAYKVTRRHKIKAEAAFIDEPSNSYNKYRRQVCMPVKKTDIWSMVLKGFC